MLEPLGLLGGRDATASIAAGLARPLAGGPYAFTMIRSGIRSGGSVMPVALAERQWPEDVAALSAMQPDWAGLGHGPLIMGIVNVTPDSFSDGGDRFEAAAAVAAGERMFADGADILDIGGESTRPGSLPIPVPAEQARVLPVVAALARGGAVVSVDTRNSATMRAAVDAGARVVNDVTALQHDAEAVRVVARAGCAVVLMHMRGTPATMMSLAQYRDVAEDVFRELSERVEMAVAGGVSRANMAIDPGFGFAKDHDQNLSLLQRLPLLLGLGCPIVVGLSRKATIGHLTGEAEPRGRDAGSAAAALYALSRGARIIRTHDVRQTRQAIQVWQAMNGAAGRSAAG